MPELELQQLLYTRLEAPYSLKGKSGYQVAYASAGIPTEDISQIEKRLQCFQGDEETKRYQYFRLDSGAIVISLSRGVSEEHPLFTKYIDQNSRGGAFIAHAIILTSDQFAHFDNHPFAVIASCSQAFITNLPRLAEQVLENRSGVPSIHIQPTFRNTEEKTLAGEWTEEKAKKLYLLGANADSLIQNKQSVMIQGAEEDVRRMIGFILDLLRPEERLQCSFDTFTDGCNPTPGKFWAVGTTKKVNNKNFIMVNYERQTVDYETKATTLPNSSPQVKWLSLYLKSSNSLDLGDRPGIIQTVVQALQSQKPVEIKPLEWRPEDSYTKREDEYDYQVRGETISGKVVIPALLQFWQANEAELSAAVLKAFREHFKEATVRAFYTDQPKPPQQPHRYVSVITLLNMASMGLGNPKVLAVPLINWLYYTKPTLDEAIWRDLQNFAPQSNGLLAFLSSTLSPKPNHQLRRWVLRNWVRNHDEFKQNFTSLYFGPSRNSPLILPGNFLIKDGVQWVIHWCLEYRHPFVEEELTDFILGVLEEGEGVHLYLLANHLKIINNPVLLDRLAKAANKAQPDQLHPDFLQALQQRQAAVPAPPPSRITGVINNMKFFNRKG